MLRLALFIALCYSVHALCPTNFSLVRNGECYRELSEARYMDARKGASIAKSECLDQGARPVIIKNQEDNDYWMSVAKENHKKGLNNGFILLGLECNSRSRWQWADGSSLDYLPDDYNPDLLEECDNHHDAWAYNCMWVINPVKPFENWQPWCDDDHYVDLYCIVPPFPNPDEPEGDCVGFSEEDDDQICYQVGKKSANWTEANSICHSFGANVASIHNDQENNFVRRLAVSKGLTNGVMMGGTWNSVKNTFKWADGTKFDYKNFVKGFPMASSGECMAMQTNNVNGQWVNVDCASDLPFACVRQTEATRPSCDGSLHKEGDIIYSPGFPYTSSEPCDFLLKVDTGMLVEVEILFLEANECCDHLMLFEGTLGGPLIVQLSGESQNGMKFRTSSQNVMRASWQPNGGVNVKGMMITFRGVPK